ncbi:MAG: hypothetical protein H6742_01135 [Alphaproteobacteria bacterium]|nr:hypothetical protein [Alphaproteobacteria bacterium]
MIPDHLLTPTFVAALGVTGLVLFLAREHVGRLVDRRATMLSWAGLGVGAAVALWATLAVTTVQHPIAEADLLPGGATLELPAGAPHASLVVSGGLPDVNQGDSAAGTYQLEVREGDAVLARYDGTLEEHWNQSRAGRRAKTQSLVQHVEDRYDLPSEATGHPLMVRVTHENGDLKGPVHVAAIHAPPAVPAMAALAVIAVALASAADGFGGQRTRLGLFAGVLGAFGLTMLDGVTPHDSAMAVLGACILAGLVGLPVAILLRSVIVRVVGGPEPEPVPAP